MIPGRLLLTLVVLTATLAVRQPALARSAESLAPPAERTTWVQRLGHGIARSFSRIGLMQRVALRVPTPRLTASAGHSSRPLAGDRPDPLRACLPPPHA